MPELGANGMLNALEVLNCKVVKSEPGHSVAMLPIVRPVMLRWSDRLVELHRVLPMVTELAMLMVIIMLAVPIVWSPAGVMTSGANVTIDIAR